MTREIMQNDTPRQPKELGGGGGGVGRWERVRKGLRNGLQHSRYVSVNIKSEGKVLKIRTNLILLKNIETKLVFVIFVFHSLLYHP